MGTSDGVTPGESLGSYRIERLLGRGGMGMVCLAYDSKLHRQVGLKVVTEAGESEESRARLLREARNAAALNHPNICTIYEVGEAGGSAFIAMEYVEGRSLSERLEAGPLPLAEALHYGIQAADALAYAHDHGVIHRDLKAANAIVTQGRRLKLVDFGLARRRGPATADATTVESIAPIGTVMGTPYAMAPEQVRGEMTDARSDIWALGVLLHEMVSGTKPFDGATMADMFSSILRDPPRPAPSSAPAELRAVIERCLEKAPERRYQNAGEVRAALEAIERGTVAPRSNRGDRTVPRRSLVAAALLAAVAAVLVGLNVGGVRDRIAGSPLGAGPIKLAVLPLDDPTGNPDQEYFGDSLTDEVISALGRLRSERLSVIASTSSMPYKRTPKPLDQVGRELDANVVLKGSVARTGDRVRVVAELRQPSSGRTLWSRTYDRDTSDLFLLGHEMSNAVAGALGVPPSEPDTQVAARTHKVNPEAYDLYLRGLSHIRRGSEPDIDETITLLEKSVAADPSFVPAQGYLASTYARKSSLYRPDDPQWEEKGFAAAQKALDLDPQSPEAHYAQAVLLWTPSHGFASREALAELRKALSAQPNFDEAWHLHATILTHVGHMDLALRELQKSLRINPGNTLARFRFGPIFVYQQKFEAAIGALDRVPREAFPAQWIYQRAWALISLGRFDDADGLLKHALEENPVDQGGVIHAARAMVRAKRGDRAGAEADVAEAVRIGKTFIHFHHTAYSIAAVYATLGDLDKAQEWVENSANNGFPNYAFFAADVHLERLRATPRFRDFLAKLRSEWEHIPGEPE